MIRAVTFDLWNTLISEKKVKANDDFRINFVVKILGEQNVCKNYSEVRDAYESAHEYAHRIWEKENCRYVTVEERLEYLLRKLKVNLPTGLKGSIIKVFKGAILKNPPSLIEGSREVLKSLETEYRLGIVCDSGITPGEVLRKILEEAAILGFFESTVFSDEVGRNKPHSLIFEKSLKGLRVEPSEAVHVGDLLETDIAGAKSIGMKAVWLKRKEVASSIQLSPDFEIGELAELINILGLIRYGSKNFRLR